MRKLLKLTALFAALLSALCGCMTEAPAPSQPEGETAPLKVYDVSEQKIVEMPLEDYVQGVVAGEMKNDWPLEALKAQAILARTFVLEFCENKKSMYEGADISTDVTEAQAYAPQDINDRVRRAVEETRGIALQCDGEYPHAWFYAHSGGMTELPSVALDYAKDDPKYLSVTASPDSADAPEEVQHWSVSFEEDEILAACAELGVKLSRLESVEIGEVGESGRAKTLVINGKSVSAPSLRIQLGANRLKSTLIEEVRFEDGKVAFRGRGFGHGVGMSQWGAYQLAQDGKTAEEIIEYYFKNVSFQKK